jgi:hypothetical protein
LAIGDSVVKGKSLLGPASAEHFLWVITELEIPSAKSALRGFGMTPGMRKRASKKRSLILRTATSRRQSGALINPF